MNGQERQTGSASCQGTLGRQWCGYTDEAFQSLGHHPQLSRHTWSRPSSPFMHTILTYKEGQRF